MTIHPTFRKILDDWQATSGEKERARANAYNGEAEAQPRRLADREILLAICETLESEWTPDTIEWVANILTTNGYRIRDIDEIIDETFEPEEPQQCQT